MAIYHAVSHRWTFPSDAPANDHMVERNPSPRPFQAEPTDPRPVLIGIAAVFTLGAAVNVLAVYAVAHLLGLVA